MSQKINGYVYPFPRPASPIERLSYSIFTNWWWMLVAGMSLLVLAPFLAPLFMQIGWTAPANLIYFVYSFLCHQLPERSFFFFGPQAMYSLGELQQAGADTSNMLTLRKFTGSVELGWKTAWSDRMVWMYAAMLFFGLIWRPVRNKVKALPWWGLVVLLLPMALDGTTHFISDLAGMGQGFRASNEWLEVLTGSAFPASFYAGDALGSFNSWMRFLTGFSFGLGVIWFGFPIVDEMMKNSAHEIEGRIRENSARTASDAPLPSRDV